jgi:hypothetical protein
MKLGGNRLSLFTVIVLFLILVPFFGAFMGVAAFVAAQTRQACAMVTSQGH